MNHKEALKKALDAFEAFDGGIVGIERAIYRYVKARCLVMVPKEPTEAMLDAYWNQTGESREMRPRVHSRARRYHDAMLAAAPDPFKDDNT